MTDPSEISQPPTTSNKRKAEWFEIDEKDNTYVYVTGLPTTITEDDFVDLMKKFGIIAKKPIAGSPYNIKLYKDKDGNFKGDAWCRYVRSESVELALTHLEEYHYDDKHVIHCERAKFEKKGCYDPSKKPRIDPRNKMKQKKNIDKLLSWDTKPSEAKQKKVILRYMFTPEEILEDAGLIIDVKEDVETKCADLGFEPKKVDIFDKHPDGVVAVTFTETSQAQACIDSLNNQFYAGRVVKAELWDGHTKFKIQETEEETEERMRKWERDIQGPDDDADVELQKELSSHQDVVPKSNDDLVTKVATPLNDGDR